MASWYVNSAAAGTNAGTSWLNACTSLSQLLGLGVPPVAGDSIFVANTSAESYAATTTLTFPGTLANPNFIYSVDTTNQPPQSSDLLAGATVTSTGASSLTLSGSFYCYGLTLQAGSGANTVRLTICGTANAWVSLDTCILQNLGTGAIGSAIAFFSGGGSSAQVTLKNTTLQLSNASQTVGCNAGGNLSWNGTASAIAGATLPTTLFNSAITNTVLIEGVDLSALGSGKTLVGSNWGGVIYIKDCKLGTSVTVAAAATTPAQTTFNIRSDSANTNYRNEKYSYTGTETTETLITRVGGAAAPDGTAFSRKYVSTANSKWVLPFQGLPLTIWCPFSSGSHTLTIYGTWNQTTTLPNNDQIWCTAEYLGTAGNPLGVFATATKANNLASGTALNSNTSTWGGSWSSSTWTSFSITISFSPTEAGLLYVYPYVADPSTTFYLDPQVGLV